MEEDVEGGPLVEAAEETGELEGELELENGP